VPAAAVLLVLTTPDRRDRLLRAVAARLDQLAGDLAPAVQTGDVPAQR